MFQQPGHTLPVALQGNIPPNAEGSPAKPCGDLCRPCAYSSSAFSCSCAALHAVAQFDAEPLLISIAAVPVLAHMLPCMQWLECMQVPQGRFSSTATCSALPSTAVRCCPEGLAALPAVPGEHSGPPGQGGGGEGGARDCSVAGCCGRSRSGAQA